MLWFVSGVAACTHPWNCETMDVCDCIYHKCLQRPQTPPRLGWPWNCLQHVGSLSWFYALRSFFGLSFGLKVYPIRFCAKDQRCGSTFDAAIRSRPPIISSLLHKNDCMTLEHFSRFFHNTHRCHAAVTVCVQLGNFQMWDQVTGSRSQMKTLPPRPVCRTSGCQRLRLQLTGWLGPRCWELLHQGRLGFFRHPKHALFEALFIRRWCSGTSVPSMCPMVNWCQRPSALATAGGNAQVQRVVCIALYYISYCTICIGHLSRYRDSGTTIAILWPNPSFWSVLLAMTLGWDEQVEEHNAILHTVAIYMFSIGTHSIRTAYAQHTHSIRTAQLGTCAGPSSSSTSSTTSTWSF